MVHMFVSHPAPEECWMGETPKGESLIPPSTAGLSFYSSEKYIHLYLQEIIIRGIKAKVKFYSNHSTGNKGSFEGFSLMLCVIQCIYHINNVIQGLALICVEFYFLQRAFPGKCACMAEHIIIFGPAITSWNWS